ncbi:nucleoside kinase [Acidaminobacter sp. JC074]|uniref:nucleoside kinase n=1 Tax=Acidaminobacter sp. JC074 TaxID=2530199 RepID=UPI001F10D6FB|nr:nucleoside kinase [Acidaminobacter sp. JC074]MCH4890382.1 nucleoside kinase [Acidaminobacter sp. JC074]
MYKVKIEDKMIELEEATSLEKLACDYQTGDKPMIVAALVNNKLRELFYEVDEDAEITWIDLTQSDGIRMYQRTLAFVFIRAAMEVFRDIHVNVRHSLSKGLYCDFDYHRELTAEDIDKIKTRMDEIIEKGEVIHKASVSLEEAKTIFEDLEFRTKANLLKYREYDYINIYTCGWLKNYFYGYMLPNVSYLTIYDIIKYDQGVILRHPIVSTPMGLPEFEEHKKIAKIFKESEAWGDIVSVGNVFELNDEIEKGNYKELMILGEALHEKKVAQIADQITKLDKKVILIAGPSSSGKTTFANRLRIQLMVNGFDPITLSTDDYFVDREYTPRDENGDFDFESIDAVDVDLFNDHLAALVAGQRVELPTFNFVEGKKEYNGKYLQIHEHQPIIIEGIHGLNERLTSQIAHEHKFKIYISALTQLNIDDHNRIPTTDSRLIRRIVRDSKYRGHDAKRTIQLWASVRRGEEKNIFPFQEEADVMFNSALSFELAILKKHAEPLLEGIEADCEEYKEAKRLLKFLSYFESIDDDDLVPVTSILKEFIGGSYFTE